MSWSYRVVKKNNKGSVRYGIHRVGYDADDKPISCAPEPIYMYATNMDEMGLMISQFKIATNQPWLKYEDFEIEK